jgi:hypothetical protein
MTLHERLAKMAEDDDRASREATPDLREDFDEVVGEALIECGLITREDLAVVLARRARFLASKPPASERPRQA